jgi:acyl-CoA synthetase (NDP forming)
MPAPALHDQLAPLFDARTVAVVGASNTPGKWGHMLMERPLKGGFTGAVIPVNPREPEVMGRRAYRSVLAIPEAVDLAVLTVPAAAAAQVLRECSEKGIRAAVIISAGFAESGPEGEGRQAELVRVAREAGIRFVGPNCNGMWSASSGLSLHSSLAPAAGSIAFVSQSGAFGGSLVDAASTLGYGVSRFVSSGNQADLNDADYLEYLGDDAETEVIAFYIEGLRDARRFLETARRVVARKPVLVYKAGRNAVGARAVHSHTASLMMPDDVFDGACRQYGLLRVHEAMHLFPLAAALADAPLPGGSRVAVMALTGGQCVVTADSCAQLGLQVPELDGETQGRLIDMLADHAPTPRNPVDLAGDFRDVALFADVAELLAELPYIDGLIVAGPGGGADSSDRLRATAERMASIPARSGKPVIAVGVRRMAEGVVPEVFRAHHVPCYETPEDSARAMHALMRFAEIRRELHGA